MTIRMVHPDLPGQSIQATELAVEIHERSGWQVENPVTRPDTAPARPLAPPEGYVLILHPETGLSVNVPKESLPHHRLAGWMLQPEYEEMQARNAAKAREEEQAAREADQAGKAKSKSKAAEASASKEE